MKAGQKTAEKKRLRIARHDRVRAKIFGTHVCPRISVFRSNRMVYVQLIDDKSGKTLASACDLTAELVNSERKGKQAKSYSAGYNLAQKAKELNIETAVFDRGGYVYHGRVKALAEGARDGGLIF